MAAAARRMVPIFAWPARRRTAPSGSSVQGMRMDKKLIEALASQAGLDRALAEFPDCVAAAAAQALGRSSEVDAPTAPTVEPWPPMRVRGRP
jgi:hypothetical protein